MWKKLILFALVFGTLNIEANEKEALKFIPADSEVRSYCENATFLSNSKIIAGYLTRMENSKKKQNRIEKIDSQLNHWPEKSNELEKRIDSFKNENEKKELSAYIVFKNKKYMLKENEKAKLEKECLPESFPREGKEKEINEFNGAFSTILETIESKKRDLERKYMKEAFENAYENNRPMNTSMTSKERISILLILVGLVMMPMLAVIALNPDGKI